MSCPAVCGRARKRSGSGTCASWGKQDEGKTLVPLSALGPVASGLQAETTEAYFKGAFVRYRPIQSHVTAQVTKSDTKKGRVHGRHCRRHSVAVPQDRPGQGHTPTGEGCHPGTWVLGSNLSVSWGCQHQQHLRRRYRPQVTRGAVGSAPELPLGITRAPGRLNGAPEVPSSPRGRYECNLGINANMMTPFVPRD